MENQMHKNLRIILVLTTLIAVALAAALWADSTFYQPFNPLRPLQPPHSIPGDFELFYAVTTVVSSVNIALLVFLLITNVDIFRKTRSKFTLTLLIFSTAFLFKNLTDSPIVIWAFGYRQFGLGPFALLPDLFEFVVLTALLYLNFE
jgi:hypothetical protein